MQRLLTISALALAMLCTLGVAEAQINPKTGQQQELNGPGPQPLIQGPGMFCSTVGVRTTARRRKLRKAQSSPDIVFRYGRTKVIGGRSSTATRAVPVVPAEMSCRGPWDEVQR